jgi:hypothetical protein
MRRVIVLAALSAACAHSLRVTSAPPGAHVLLDGKDTGEVTPYALTPRAIGSGEHTVAVERDGRRCDPQRVTTHGSVRTVIVSLIFPPALLVHIFSRGFADADPDAVHCDLEKAQP